MSATRLLVLLLVKVCTAIEVDDAVFSELTDTVSLLEEKVILQDNQIAEQQDEIQRLQEEIKELKGGDISKRQAIQEGPVAFTAAIAQRGLDHLQSQDTIIFEKVITNYANGYHNDTGIFTVPLHGIYLFSCSVFDQIKSDAHGSVKVHAEIVQNGVTLARVFAHADTDYRDQGAQTIVVEADAGDQVWVKIMDNNDLSLGGSLYTTFSGYMLWQLS